MQAAADTLKAAVTGEKTSATGLKEYQRGYKPDPKGEKEAQGGEGSRPPGKQTVMLGESILLSRKEFRSSAREVNALLEIGILMRAAVFHSQTSRLTISLPTEASTRAPASLKEKSGSSAEATRESVVRPPSSLRTRAPTCEHTNLHLTYFQPRMCD
jgi:hypothetical protein